MNTLELNCYTSYMVIHLDRIKKNLEAIRRYTGSMDILPVVKSNAYGLGTTGIASYLVRECHIPMLACADLFEACQIIDAVGPDVQILILSAVPMYSIEETVRRHIQIPVFTKETARRVSQAALQYGIKEMPTHLPIETGMNRIGVKPGKDLEELVTYIRSLGNLTIDGVYTHFATAENTNRGKGDDYARLQFSRFRKALEQLHELNIYPRMVHCCNSGATLWMKESFPLCTHVRVGNLFLGYANECEDWDPIGLHEVASWKTTVLNLRNIAKGEPVGYDWSFIAPENMKVATIGIGYGDGYLRNLAMKEAPVLIHGHRAPFIGICMDQAFIDVTGLSVRLGDEVTVYGEDSTGARISELEITDLLGETGMALLTHISDRVARVYVA